jgi:hypothetical protein
MHSRVGFAVQDWLPKPMSIERVVPVPVMSPDGCTMFSAIRASKFPARALLDVVRADRLQLSDLPEIIANVWTRDDSPTSDLSEAGWLEIFRAAGFFCYPPLAVRSPDGTRDPLGRPGTPVTLYRGSTAERQRRMSWAYEPAMAEQLGTRHAHHDAAVLYQATVAPDAILAYLERRDEGWTIVVHPAGLANIERLKDLPGRHGPVN